ncbi:guanine nucleotide exchange factor subunit Rich [Nasonia vitripennis]|uniref:Protein RIC1 homolog n=1 Tax=Nasonia vitripennis TaxID=7425 RepID=A0A7M7QGM0_NASVI|nr:guanine nucleotide exchange factor subunit Rich [Nasonia vitripennis]XP_031786428.1 guanine nucleotide exchange factor subunit Rich [Nasonia vitripennis]XP_031786429.1 guanine nucleotide exchange factor subunit Rich [Nasonia vitripennis]
MFFPVGWPRVLKVSEAEKICSITCNRDKILFGILTTDAISIWCCKPCVPLVYQKRTPECLQKYGESAILEWRPDSSMLVIATNDSYLLFYKLFDQSNEAKSPYEQKDSPINGLKRDSAELFIKESIPSIQLKFEKCVWIDGGITSFVCIRDELMIATKTSFIIRHKWDGTQNRDYSLDLRRIPFSIDQQISTSAAPITTKDTYVTSIDYSPLVGGFAVVFNCGKAAFLTAQSLKFDPNQVIGVWARDLDDATCAAVNHKYRLIAFGRKNSQALVLYVDETTGSLEVSHSLVLSTKDYPGVPGSVSCLRWTPDSCAIALAWSSGGVAIWSTFGALLMCTLKWDYGLNVDPLRGNPFQISTMEWSAEGYQLWMLKDSYILPKENCSNNKNHQSRSVVHWEFVKSPLTVNPCMSHNGHIYLQGEDRLYINLGHKIFSNNIKVHFSNADRSDGFCHVLSGTKQWLVVPIPNAYTSCNWPIRFTAIDEEGQSIAVAGKTGLAHYSMLSRKWKLFGNEYQERDFVVTGGLLWYNGYLITSSYSIPENEDEIRIYPRDVRLDNNHVRSIKMTSQILLLNILKNLLLVFCANSQIRLYTMTLKKEKGGSGIELVMIQTIDISSLCPHPACVVSASLTLIRTEITDDNLHPETLLLNVSGKLLMVQRDHWQESTDVLFTCAVPTVLASSVENIWIPWESKKEKPYLTEAVWLFCGAHGMKVWLPLVPKRHQDKVHTFMSKTIMLPFYLKIYPLTILFEDVIILGAENDTVLYTSDTSSPFILPFSVLELTSQVYLHQVLRQLIHRNLGYQAWEIAMSCSSLPYFSHSLELLLHEVLEEEATSKEPLPDAQLPSVVEFIQSFPGFWARAIVQCARKTEIALWPYLFSVVGPPKKLLQTCLNNQELDTAASYLLILQNLEASSVSKQYATMLLDAALKQGRSELSRDLVRFLKAIDPTDADLIKTSNTIANKKSAQRPSLSTQEDDLTLVLGTMQVSRNRSFSTSSAPKLNSDSHGKDNAR